MEFNVSKCKNLQVSTCTKCNYSYSTNGAGLESVESHSYLGVQIHHQLLWNPHINSICNKANKLIGFLLRNLRHCPPILKETAYKQLVLPCLEYCTFIWDPFQTCLIHQLEMVQHRAGHFVLNYPWCGNSCDSISQMLSKLNWCPLETRRKQSRLLLLFNKLLNHFV